MIDKIVLSKDKRSALVVFDNKSFNLYHSEGKVMDLVEEMFLNPIRRIESSEETTQVTEDYEQLSFFSKSA